MKKKMIPIVAILFSVISLNADDGQITREFTVTQLALDIQNAQMAQEEIDENNNSSTKNIQYKKDDTEDQNTTK